MLPQVTKKEQAKTAVKQLIEKYERVKSQERAKEYSEQTTNKDFIMPLFEALGWDVYNKKTDDEVTAEESVSKKRVDFAFRLNGMARLFLECKALKVDLEQEKWAEQATNYAHIKGVVWAALTNFESIKVFNSQLKSESRIIRPILDIGYNEFLTKFDDLWLLSRESFETGLIDKIAEGRGQKFKKVPVGEQLLLDLTTWRSRLSKDILERNKSKQLSEEDLDESVQRILDRLIFIRKCEDSELEQPNLLLSKVREWEGNPRGVLAKHIFGVFSNFNDIYDSKLFESHLCDDLEISNQVISEVINGLYHTKDRAIQYDFSAIDADVLGGVYEQYLGHILKKTAKRATVTEKHAHRKEQGIYYTPTYIVDYIVKNTLGELLKTKGPKEAEKIRVLDPACGSGSFLIKAFDVFDKYFKKASGSQQELEFARRSKILTENIFGVDLDPKAVEIAQLNLLLKTAEKKERLPMLQNNIKCGNSLIDDPTVAKERAFKWDSQFQKIMKDEGGFDVVVGNPPYGIVFKENEKRHIEEHLPSFRRNNDVYVAFIEKSLSLLNEEGLFSFIIPNTYLIGPYFDSLKRLILDKAKIIKILNFGINPVFQDPNVFNSVIVLQKESNSSKREKNTIEFYDVPLLKNSEFLNLENVSSKTKIVQLQFNNLIWKPKNDIIDKILSQKDKLLDELCYVKDVGFNYWSIGRGKKRGDSIGSRVLYEGERQNQKDIPFLKGRDIGRYNYSFGNHWLRYDYEKYLNKKIDTFRFSPAFLEVSPKIIYRQTADRIIATLDYNKYHLDKTVHLIISKEDAKINILSLLGILNSTLMLHLYRDMVREKGRTFAQVKTVYIKKIPLKFNENIETKISELVKKQLELNTRLLEIGDKKTDERARVEGEIRRTDAEIDELVYRLYGITDEEKKIIEESLK